MPSRIRRRSKYQAHCHGATCLGNGGGAMHGWPAEIIYPACAGRSCVAPRVVEREKKKKNIANVDITPSSRAKRSVLNLFIGASGAQKGRRHSEEW